MPPVQVLGPVRYTPALLAYVALVMLSAVGLAAALVRNSGDWTTLGAGATATFLMAFFAVRSLPVQTGWSPGVFLHLGLSIVLGPIGAVGAAIAETAGVGLRTRNGWFRTGFNLANLVLSDLAAWAVYTSIQHAPMPTDAAEVLGGLAAGVSQYSVNHGLLALVVRIANPSVPLSGVLRNGLSVLPYSVGYGIAGFTFVVMHQQAGALGFSALLVPVILLHGFLIVFARRVHAYEEQREAHRKEREELLHRAVDASESERRRIARDLHDGVVQNLAGMAFTMMATASKLKEKSADNGQRELVEMLEQSAEETRLAMKDLRTLIIEIAPPTLRREGLHAALLEVMRTLKSGGTKTRLELPSNMRLRPDRASLIFRVAQEVLRNVAAHAEAKQVSVVFEGDGRQGRAAHRRRRQGLHARRRCPAPRRRSRGHQRDCRARRGGGRLAGHRTRRRARGRASH